MPLLTQIGSGGGTSPTLRNPAVEGTALTEVLP